MSIRISLRVNRIYYKGGIRPHKLRLRMTKFWSVYMGWVSAKEGEEEEVEQTGDMW
jgi:hypothetical protein